MTIQLNKPADLLGMVGQEIGTGEWHAITQHQVNIFADATHDHQWIHVEPERAAKGPYGGPIAHGYLTLSLCPVFLDDVLKIDAVTAAVNYGVNKFRFPARCRSAAGYAGTSGWSPPHRSRLAWSARSGSSSSSRGR